MRHLNSVVSRRASAFGMLGAALAALLCGPAWAAADTGSGGEPAVWTPKEARFVFLGFTTHYSCDGLADKMKEVLLQLGARPADLHVYPMPCSTPYGRPDPFPGVTIKMDVLEPASAAKDQSGSAVPQTVPAHWKTVEINLARDPVWAAGQCELLEQIKEQILPKFATRNVQYRSDCVPNQLTVGATTLRADVLLADNPGAKTAGAAAPGATAAGTAAAGAAAAGAAALIVYPRNGQTAAQTQTDREECQRWAAHETGFDPTQPAQEASGKATEYRRAMIACLDARGYTAR